MTSEVVHRKRGLILPALGFVLVALTPTALAGLYYYRIAADRYVTEFRYSVRGGAMNPDAGGGVVGGAGGAAGLVFAGDSFILEDYLTSLQAVADIEARLPLREMLDRDGGDPVRGFDPAIPPEELIDFWAAAVRPNFDATTGITTVTVTLFRPEDAEAVAAALVDELTRIVESLSEKARNEMLTFVNAEFEAAAQELGEARRAIEAFRLDNQIITPSEEVTIGSTIITTLTEQLTDRRVELRALRDRAPNSPRIPVLEGDIESLEAQLLTEFERRGQAQGERDALPQQLSSFDELQNAYEIARETYVSTFELRQQAEATAVLGQPELVVFVPPRRAELSTKPYRPVEILKVFGAAFAAWLVGRILLASFRTH